MARKPRILLGVTADISNSLMRGFPEFLSAGGWDVHLVSAPGPLLEQMAALPSVTVHAIPMAREPSIARDLQSLLKWVVLLRGVRPDVVSVGTPKAGLLAGVAGFMTRVPRRIYMLRGLRLETTTGWKRRILTQMERMAAATAHEVLAVSPSLMQRAIDLRLVRPAKIVVLGKGSSNGVDTDSFRPGRYSDSEIASRRSLLGLEIGVPVIGFVGRLATDKGLSVLIAAQLILDRRGVDHQLLVVGGDDGVRGGCIPSSLAHHSVMTGHVSDAGPYYPLMDLLCLPTLREGFPNVVLEAGASGIPTVTTDATGAVDSVLHGGTGLIARAGDAESLANCLEELLVDAERRIAFGAASLEYVRTHFSRSMVWAASEEFYSERIATRACLLLPLPR